MSERTERVCKEIEDGMNDLLNNYVGKPRANEEEAVKQSVIKYLTGKVPNLDISAIHVKRSKRKPGVVEVTIPEEILEGGK